MRLMLCLTDFALQTASTLFGKRRIYLRLLYWDVLAIAPSKTG